MDDEKRRLGDAEIFRVSPKPPKTKKPKVGPSPSPRKIQLKRPLRLKRESTNSLRIMNGSPNAVDLSNWTLAVTEFGIEVTLSDISVPGGDSVLFVFGNESAQLHDPPRVYFIDEIEMQERVNAEEFSVELVDLNGRVSESLAIKNVPSDIAQEYCTIS